MLIIESKDKKEEAKTWFKRPIVNHQGREIDTNLNFDIATFKELVKEHGGNRDFSAHFGKTANWSTKLSNGYGDMKPEYLRQIYDDFGVDLSIDKIYEKTPRMNDDVVKLDSKKQAENKAKVKRVKLDREKLELVANQYGGAFKMAEDMGRSRGYISELIKHGDTINKTDYLYIKKVYGIDVELIEPVKEEITADDTNKAAEIDVTDDRVKELYKIVYTAAYNGTKTALKEVEK